MKKTLSTIKKIVVWLVTIVAVCMMVFTLISVTTFDRIDRGIFGFKAFIVLSDSMSADNINAGDLVISKYVDPSTLKEGDIITYQSTNSDNYGAIVTHKIRRLTTDENGSPGFITYGTTTDTDDQSVVTYNFVIGKFQTKLKGVGKFFWFLKTTPGYIVCILLPFLTLILIQGLNSVKLFRQYRKEQMSELEEERQKIAEERLEQQRMMQELLRMKQELNIGTKDEENK